MYGVRQTVALLLFAVGALLVLLAVTAVVTTPPRDVGPDVVRVVTTFFLVGGVLGLGVFGWGIYLRTTHSKRGTASIWAVYGTLLTLLIALFLFVWREVAGIVGDATAASGDFGRLVVALVMLLSFLLGPIILKLRGSRRGKPRPADDQPPPASP